MPTTLAKRLDAVARSVLGVGKTSFARQLSQELSGKLVLEEVDNNPFLDKFYRDMK